MEGGHATRYSGVTCVLMFFFFQAEDGIRDLTVTGVQTCALPISNGEGDDDTGPTARPQAGLSSRTDRYSPARYSASLTFSIQSALLPSSCSTMAMCVMAVVAAAPCQCFSPGGIQITSPGRISSIGPPQRCARPQPAVTIRVWPSGWVCHAVRAPGSNVTVAPSARNPAG